jgi:sugar phosphate isomerase/epimerase
MKIKFFCPRWGSEELSWNSFCEKVKNAGYDGVEAGVPFDEGEKQESDNYRMRTALERYQLSLIGQYWQSFEKDFTTHKVSYEKHLYHLASMQPVKIDAQTGKDYFSFDQNKELFDIDFSFSEKSGIPVAHETHRNKALFAAHVAKNFLEKIPSLRITADFSHWCNVAESFLEDQPEALNIAMQHAIHIHARVGHTQSAQVTDPRLPEWQIALQHHTSWWTTIISHHQKIGTDIFTITPEFGPAPYMPASPVSKKPLANQWEINEWMIGYLRKEWGLGISNLS